MYSPMSDLDSQRNWTLDELSSKKATMLTPSVVYLCILMIFGIVGNAIVLTVYYFRYSASTHRCFILVLAFYDFFVCSIGVPWAIAESFHAYTYTEVVSCKIFRFILYYTCIASSLTLVLIAFERFRKICRPLKSQMTVPIAKRALFIVAGIISFISASPVLVLYGNSTIPTGLGDVNGTRCFISDKFEETIWPTAFNVYLLILAFVSTVCMSCCYGCIARQVSRMGESNVIKKNREKANGRPTSSACASDELDGEIKQQKVAEVPNTSLHRSSSRNSIEELQSSGMASVKVNTSVLRRGSKWANNILRRILSKTGQKTMRMTKIMTAVTIAFVISNIPHLSLVLWSMFTTKADSHILPTDNFYQVIFYLVFLNSLVNPFIYASMDFRFRKAAKDFFLCNRNIDLQR